MPFGKTNRARSVFISCPFDPGYKRLLRAACFTMLTCGYLPRCALDYSDSGAVRFTEIVKLITACDLSVNDISRVKLDHVSRLPRFNMPLELGADLGLRLALTTNGVQIDTIGGTSIGAVVAAVFATECDLGATMLSLATGFAKRRWSDFAIPRTALYSERAFARTLGNRFGEIAIEDLPIPMFCVSTNLTQGVSVVHRTGRLVTWLRASTAVPGICPPILEGNNVYIDGGVLNNVPTDGMRGVGVASVISVDVGSAIKQPGRSDDGEGLPNMWELLWRVGTIASDTAAKNGWQDGDVALRPEIGAMGLFDWDARERAIAAGHQVVVEHLGEIEAALGRVR